MPLKRNLEEALGKQNVILNSLMKLKIPLKYREDLLVD